MTAATVASPTGNGYAVLLCMFLLVSAITCVGWWVFEQRSDKQGDKLDTHDEQLATLTYELGSLKDFLRVDIPKPAVDDSPAAETRTQEAEPNVAFELPPDDAQTDEFPAIPETEPDGIAIQVQSALLARDLSDERPHPVDSDAAKARTAQWVEAELEKIRARIEAAQGAA